MNSGRVAQPRPVTLIKTGVLCREICFSAVLDLRFTDRAVVTAVRLYHLTAITEPDRYRHGDKEDHIRSHV